MLDQENLKATKKFSRWVFWHRSKAESEKLVVGGCGSTSKTSVQVRCVESKKFYRAAKCPRQRSEK